MQVKFRIRAGDCTREGHPEGKETVSLARGRTETIQGRLRLRYTELLAGDDGSTAETRVILLASPDKVMMRRDGDFSSIMRFICGGTPTEGVYQTPYGGIPFELRTLRLELAGGEAEGSLFLCYGLTMRGSGELFRRLSITWEADPC